MNHRSPLLDRRSFLGLTTLSTVGAAMTGVSADDTKVLKVGLYLPFTGNMQPTSASTAAAIQIAVEEANNAGFPGDYKLRLVRFDHGSLGHDFDLARAAENAHDAVSDPLVVALLGPAYSSIGFTAIPILNAAGLTMISWSASAPGLTKGEEADALRKARPDAIAFFRVCGTNDIQGPACAQLARKIGLAKMYVLDDSDLTAGLYGTDLADIFSISFRASGGNIVGREAVNKDTDFTILLHRVRNAGADGLFFGALAPQLARLRISMASAGMLGTPLLAGSAMSEPTFIETVKRNAVNSYFTRTTPDIAHLKNPLTERFIQLYHRRWQVDPNSLQAAAYAAAQVLIRAIRLALATKPSLNQIREGIRIQTASAGEIPTAIGRVSFDRNGDILNPYISFYRYDEHFSANFVNQLIVRS